MTTYEAAGHLDPGYRTVLVSSAAINIVMFFAEDAVGLVIGSAALIADAADFLEDSGMYSLAVLAIGWGARNRPRAGAAMGCMMTGVGLVALWQVVERLRWGGARSSLGMAATAAALAVNLYCATRLAPYSAAMPACARSGFRRGTTRPECTDHGRRRSHAADRHRMARSHRRNHHRRSQPVGGGRDLPAGARGTAREQCWPVNLSRGPAPSPALRRRSPSCRRRCTPSRTRRTSFPGSAS
jgi:Co/Zn/Cd efflux system component